MLDSGCSTCIGPISQVPKGARKHMTHSDIHLKGINGSITVLGEVNCDITISNHNTPVFKELNVPVAAQATLVLIGQNILGHDTLDSYSKNDRNATIEFRRTLTSGHTIRMTQILPAFFAYNSTSIITIERNCNLLGISAEQLKDDTYSEIIRALQSADSSGTHIDPEDHSATLLKKHMHQFFLEPGISVLMIRDSKHFPKLVVSYKLRARYLYQAHESTNNSGVTHMRELLSSYW